MIGNHVFHRSKLRVNRNVMINIDYFMVDECVRYFYSRVVKDYYERVSAANERVSNLSQRVNKIVQTRQP